MFQFQLVIRRQSNTTLRLSMSIVFRILLLFIAGVFVAGMAMTGAFSWIPFIILVISVLASLYNDSWIFDKNWKTAEHRFGLLFLFKRKQFLLSDIKELEIRQFIKGSLDYLKEQQSKSNEGATDQYIPEIGTGVVGSKIKKRTGPPPVRFIELNLVLENGKSINLETTKARHYDYFREKSKTIADFLEKPLISREKV